jgi:hypothetical protein
MGNKKVVKTEPVQHQPPTVPGFYWARVLNDEWGVVEVVRENAALVVYPTGWPRSDMSIVTEWGEKIEKA